MSQEKMELINKKLAECDEKYNEIMAKIVAPEGHKLIKHIFYSIHKSTDAIASVSKKHIEELIAIKGVVIPLEEEKSLKAAFIENYAVRVTLSYKRVLEHLVEDLGRVIDEHEESQTLH